MKEIRLQSTAFMTLLNHIQFKATGILNSVCGYTENPVWWGWQKKKGQIPEL